MVGCNNSIISEKEKADLNKEKKSRDLDSDYLKGMKEEYGQFMRREYDIERYIFFLKFYKDSIESIDLNRLNKTFTEENQRIVHLLDKNGHLIELSNVADTILMNRDILHLDSIRENLSTRAGKLMDEILILHAEEVRLRSAKQ